MLEQKVYNAMHQKELARKKRRRSLPKLMILRIWGVNILVGILLRQRLAVAHPDLLQVICEIAILNSAAHARRQTEEIRSCKTLKSFTNKLKIQGFSVSEGAVSPKKIKYFRRLTPREHCTYKTM